MAETSQTVMVVGVMVCITVLTRLYEIKQTIFSLIFFSLRRVLLNSGNSCCKVHLQH